MKLERLNLESSRQSWKVRAEVGQLSMTTFQFHLIFPTSARIFQLQRNFPTSAKLSNFVRFFPTSLGSFQLKQKLCNFRFSNLKLSNFRLSNLKLSNFSFFPTALFDYTYPYCTDKRWVIADY